MEEDIRNRCRKMLADCYEMTEEKLQKKYEKDNLEMDSLIMFDFVIELEEEFGVEYQDFDELTLHIDRKSTRLKILILYSKFFFQFYDKRKGVEHESTKV